ncbi:MAG TPA: TolC family protein [Thiothrix sp.]|nr:TolC family protein [Thiothrix sp.]
MQAIPLTKTRHRVFSTVLVLSSLMIIPSTFAAQSQASTLRTLSVFVTQLEKQHPLLQASQASTAAAAARTRAASQPLYNPEVEFDAERTGFTSNNVDIATVGLNQTIDWHDKRSARKNIATVEQQATRYEAEATRQQLIARILSSLADYHIQREITQAHTKRLSLTQQVFSQAMRRYNAGDISKLDLEQIRLNQTQTQLTLDRAKTELAAKAQTLAAVAGVSRKRWPSLPYAPPAIQPATLNYQRILNNLPTLKAAATRVAVARNTMRLRVREQKADPTVGVKGGAENSEAVIGFTVSIPLNIRNNFRAEVDEAKANLQQAESLLANTKHQLKTRLQSAAQTHQLTYSGWKSWQSIAGSSLQKQSQLLLRLWKAGELSTSDYFVQLNQIREAELNNVELKGNIWKSWFNWLATSNQLKQWLNGSIK